MRHRIRWFFQTPQGLLTVILASSSLGGPVFLLAGPVMPAVLQRAAPGVLVRSVILP